MDGPFGDGFWLRDDFSPVSHRISLAQQLSDASTLEGGPKFRIAIIALAATNMAAAIFMIGNILYDAWTMRHWDFETRRQKYFGWLLKIHSAEMFPLIISASVVLQALIFIPIQSLHAQPILFQGCGKVVQLMFPALWLAFSTMLVFGLETAFRSLRRVRFPSRNRWHIPTALAVVAVMIIAAWAATNVFPTRGKCLTGLIWWTARYAKLAVVLSSGLLALYPASAIIITVQLVKTVKVDKAERIAATRVVYYLIVNTWLIALVVPYYIQILTGTSAMRTAQIAEVALNVTGIINLIMHVVLRSNADRLAIRSVETPWTDKRTMRVFGPSDLNVRQHISYPVLWQPSDEDCNSSTARSDKASQSSPTDSHYDAYSPSGPLQHVVFPSPEVSSGTSVTPPLKTSPIRRVTQNSARYKVFPNPQSAIAHMSTSTTFSDVNDRTSLPLPPAPLFASKHDRNVSSQSSETVQIGLRLSYMNHALDPIEVSPPSIIGLPIPLQTAGDRDANIAAPPRVLSASGSSEALRDFTILPARSYSEDHEPAQARNVMPNPAERYPASALPISQADMPPLYTSNALRAVPRVVDLSSSAAADPEAQDLSRQHQKPESAFPRLPVKRPPPAFSPQPANRPQVRINTQIATEAHSIPKSPSPTSSKRAGLPTRPKPAPSWRPQNWNTPKNMTPVSTKTTFNSGEEKAFPGQKTLPAIPMTVHHDPRMPDSNNPSTAGKPQVIFRPPGWI